MTNSPAVIIELHVWVIRKQGHGHCRVRDFFSDHQAGQSLPKWVVVHSRMPNRNFFGLPGFDRPNGKRLSGNERDVAAAGGTRILRNGQRMQIDNSSTELSILGGP